ncbi:hypothetical protein NPIL_381781 [Nephila pilipes]|uniref:Uncharacterized protein n=1 Tax=Nephila pilipes TaxID=299642 RepID=A0A8X6T793_NEPPI|nr:hypothetical protein NPIL_381781 [Nephila pilipes]
MSGRNQDQGIRKEVPRRHRKVLVSNIKVSQACNQAFGQTWCKTFVSVSESEVTRAQGVLKGFLGRAVPSGDAKSTYTSVGEEKQSMKLLWTSSMLWRQDSTLAAVSAVKKSDLEEEED